MDEEWEKTYIMIIQNTFSFLNICDMLWYNKEKIIVLYT